MESPSWPELRTLMNRPKPLLQARISHRRGGKVLREATLVYDGEGWLVKTAEGLEATLPRYAVVVSDESRMQGFLRDETHLAKDEWAKSMIEPRHFAYLDSASGATVESATLLGRSAWRASVTGLKRASHSTFQVWIDAELGVILRLEGNGDEVDIQSLDLV